MGYFDKVKNYKTVHEGTVCPFNDAPCLSRDCAFQVDIEGDVMCALVIGNVGQCATANGAFTVAHKLEGGY